MACAREWKGKMGKQIMKDRQHTMGRAGRVMRGKKGKGESVRGKELECEPLTPGKNTME